MKKRNNVVNIILYLLILFTIVLSIFLSIYNSNFKSTGYVISNDNSLVGYFTFDDQILDLSKSKLNGINNGLLFGEGKNGYGLKIQGSQKKIVYYGNLPEFNQITLSYWVKLNNQFDKSYKTLQNYNPVAKEGEFKILMAPNGVHFVIATENNPWYSDGTTATLFYDLSEYNIEPNNWYLITGTYDGNYVKLYLNDKLVATGIKPVSGKLIKSQFNLTIGNADEFNIAAFDGYVDDVRIYDRALNLNEISELYNVNSINQVNNYNQFTNNTNENINLNIPNQEINSNEIINPGNEQNTQEQTETNVNKPRIPIPSLPTSNYLVGAFIMPQFRLGLGEHVWPLILDFPERKPLLGYYDDSNPEANDWIILWAREHGINFFIFNWYRCGIGEERNSVIVDSCKEELNKPIVSEKISQISALEKGFLRSNYKNLMNFTIMMGTNAPHQYSFNNTDDLRDNLMPYLIENYYKQPNYLKIDGKPVMFIYYPSNFEDILGTKEKVKEALNIMRQKTIEAGFNGLILIGDDGMFAGRIMNNHKKLKEYGFDYTFTYSNQPYVLDGKPNSAQTKEEAIIGEYQSYEYLKENKEVPFIITASPFWNNYPLTYKKEDFKFFISPSGYQNLLLNMTRIMSQLPKDELGSKMILVDSWSEFSEGHYVSPTKEFGFDYLKSIRNVLTNKDNTPNYRLPEELNLGPYDLSFNEYLIKKSTNYSVAKRSIITLNDYNRFKEIFNIGFPIEEAKYLTIGGMISPDKFPTNGHSSIFLEKALSFRMLFGENGAGHCVIATKNNPWYSKASIAEWPSGKIKVGEWNQILCIYNGTNILVYINGEKVIQNPDLISGNVFRQGGRIDVGFCCPDSNMESFNGKVANLKIENKSYNENEIKNEYEEFIQIGHLELSSIDSCTSKSCSELGFECGKAIDNCGNPLICGECKNGFKCNESKCVSNGFIQSVVNYIKELIK